MGLTPFNENKLKINLCIPQIIMIVLAVILYWLGTFNFISIERSVKHYTFSVIANLIQAILNAIALSVALCYTLLRQTTFNSMIQSFEKLDAELKYLKIPLNYNSDIKNCRILLMFCLILLLFATIYDLFVSILVFGNFKFWYWFVTFVPIIILTLAFLQAFFVISFIKHRFKMINEFFEDFLINDKLPLISVSELTSKIFFSLTELCELSHYVELLFGPLFLTGILTNFAGTSIQLFNCYIIVISDHKKDDVNSIWALIQSVEIIGINLLIVIGITTVCESILMEVEKAIQYLSKQQISLKKVHVELTWTCSILIIFS